MDTQKLECHKPNSVIERVRIFYTNEEGKLCESEPHIKRYVDKKGDEWYIFSYEKIGGKSVRKIFLRRHSQELDPKSAILE